MFHVDQSKSHRRVLARREGGSLGAACRAAAHQTHHSPTKTVPASRSRRGTRGPVALAACLRGTELGEEKEHGPRRSRRQRQCTSHQTLPACSSRRAVRSLWPHASVIPGPGRRGRRRAASGPPAARTKRANASVVCVHQRDQDKRRQHTLRSPSTRACARRHYLVDSARRDHACFL